MLVISPVVVLLITDGRVACDTRLPIDIIATGACTSDANVSFFIIESNSL
jgi:hypothetical protein